VARMIPSDEIFVRDRGERAVYRTLRDAAGTEDWVVLHSVPLPESRSQVIAEADFVVLIPGRAVLVLEVKNWTAPVEPQGYDVWVTAKGHSSNPYAQSAGQRQALTHALRAVGRPPVLDMVAWPRLNPSRIDFTGLRNFSPDQTLFSDDLTTNHIAAAIERNLRSVESRLADSPRMAPLVRALKGSKPTEADIAATIGVLRPQSEVLSAAAPSSRTDTVLEMLDAKQRESRDALRASQSPRTLIYGPAGSGKTVLAIDCARRRAAEGSRVLYLCPSEALATWVAGQIIDAPANLEISTVEALLRQWTAGIEALESSSHDSEPVFTPASDEGASGDFRFVVVDEAQDVLGDPDSETCRLAAGLLDQRLAGGWEAGRWALFADPYQTISEPVRMPIDPLNVIRSIAAIGEPTILELPSAYRSPRDVYGCVRHLGNENFNGLYENLAGTLESRPDEDADPSWQFVYYDGEDAQASALGSVIGYYTDELGYWADDIVVLSTASGTTGLAADGNWRQGTTRLNQDSEPDKVRYGHLDDFQGMDSRVVVVTDLFTDFVPDDMVVSSPVSWPEAPARTRDGRGIALQLYRAMSRATEHVTVLVPRRMAFWLHELWTANHWDVEGFSFDSPVWRRVEERTLTENLVGAPGPVRLDYELDDNGAIVLVNDERTRYPIPEIVGPLEIHPRSYAAHWARVFGHDDPHWREK